MKKFKFDFKRFRNQQVSLDAISDRLLLVNLYLTQLLVLIIGSVILLFQRADLKSIFSLSIGGWHIVLWGAGFAALVIAGDMLISRFVPEHMTDDGGMNRRMFGPRPLWHLALICLVVSVCEEVLFRAGIGGIIGPYWTSILFALIHVRYLQHWIMTGMVFCISYGLGWMYEYTGTLWAPIVAHFLIDFVMGCIIKYNERSEKEG